MNPSAQQIEAAARSWWNSISHGRTSWSSQPRAVKDRYRDYAKLALMAARDA